MVLPLTYFHLPKSARAYLFPQSVKIHYFCSGPIGADPTCPQPTAQEKGSSEFVITIITISIIITTNTIIIIISSSSSSTINYIIVTIIITTIIVIIIMIKVILLLLVVVVVVLPTSQESLVAAPPRLARLHIDKKRRAPVLRGNH